MHSRCSTAGFLTYHSSKMMSRCLMHRANTSILFHPFYNARGGDVSIMRHTNRNIAIFAREEDSAGV